ncbi:hypothetical protein ACHAXR_001163, partial [Thalassiosira sp. AJA248-18]
MGNQPSNGTGGSMSSRRSINQHQQSSSSSGGASKPPPGGAAPVGYMQSQAHQYPGSGGIAGKRSTSDHSMTDMTSSNSGRGASSHHSSSHHHNSSSNHNPNNNNINNNNTPLDLATISALEEDTVPTVFRWIHGGRNVYITGTFNGWSRQIPMHRSGNDFTYIHNLQRGKHAFKFIVDDEWRFAPDQHTAADIEGRINNFVDVTDFKAYTGDKDFENERHASDHCSQAVAEAERSRAENAAAAAANANEGGGDYWQDDSASGKKGGGKGKGGTTTTSKAKSDLDGEVYGHTMPDLDEYTKEPPPLPPHLRHIILNKPPQLQDTAALPVPQHVALNHLY